MRKRIRYTDEAMGKVRVVKDFLPSPEQLVLREDSVKVTISLSKSSVDYFKRVASENRTQYQKLIRKVLDLYASHFMSQ
jgi:predicted DNA binding CopG/RHH family protein